MYDQFFSVILDHASFLMAYKLKKISQYQQTEHTIIQKKTSTMCELKIWPGNHMYLGLFGTPHTLVLFPITIVCPQRGQQQEQGALQGVISRGVGRQLRQQQQSLRMSPSWPNCSRTLNKCSVPIADTVQLFQLQEVYNPNLQRI